MRTKEKAPAADTAKGFVSQFEFVFEDNCVQQTRQEQSCPRCARDVKAHWLVAILYSPSQPVRVVGFCASCAGDLRYANLARQRAICDEIAEHIGAGRRAA